MSNANLVVFCTLGAAQNEQIPDIQKCSPSRPCAT
jgi:hypothetical protein